MVPTSASHSVEAWLQWFETSEAGRCRAYLSATYGVEPADAEELMQTVRLQIFLHWETLHTPLAYFWTTLHHAVYKYLRARTKERQRRETYTRQQRLHATLEACTVRQVTDVLALATPEQRQVLGWFVQGYDDAQVAVMLDTTPHAVRQRRYTTYVALRQRGAY